jgi:phosphatidylinositol glycan class B
MKKNLIENVSQWFGVSPPTEYLKKTFPSALNIALIPVLLGIINNLYECKSKRQFPYIVVLMSTYIVVFSLIPHKEDRFVLPTIPFMLLIAGDYLYKKMK